MTKKMKRWDRKKKKYTLKDDIYRELDNMLKEGQNTKRDEDKKNKKDLTQNKIYSFVTYKNYKRSCLLFASYLGKNFPKVRSLTDIKIEHVNSYLESLMNRDLSAPTINSYKSAIAKVMGISTKDFIETPKVQRKNITRSRYEAKRDKHISQKTEEKFAKYTTAIGGRRSEMENLKGTDLKKSKKTGTYYVLIRNGKGGKKRYSPIIGKNKEETKEIVEMFKKSGNTKVFGKLPSHYDNHYYRAQYAKRLYKILARPIEKIDNPKEIYRCRKDKAGIVYDRKAMLKVSEYLGHNRVDVIARHYLY